MKPKSERNLNITKNSHKLEGKKHVVERMLKLYISISLSLSFDLPKTTSAMSSIKFHAHLARGATLAKLKDPLLLGERNI